MKKIIFGTVLTLVFALSAVVIATPKVEAACNYIGYTQSGGNCNTSYQNAYTNTYLYANAYNYNQTAMLQAYIQQLLAMLTQLQNLQAQLGYTDVMHTGISQVDVSTLSPKNVEHDRATMRGTVDFNNEDSATVYFEYGRTAANLSSDTTHVVLDADAHTTQFNHTVTGLRNNTTLLLPCSGRG